MTWSDTSAHTEGFVSVPGARLHYLDWGGTGPNLILIHGLGDNPHAFDDLVPSLGGRFRILAYARRGHGRSSKDGPFDTATLVGDLTALMDSLEITTAHLAGWSMGGTEITGMAGQHPERVGKIVYLDAGYDWADPAFVAALQELPVNLVPPPEARASLDGFRAWYRALWFPGMTDSDRVEAYIRGLVDVAPDGTVRPVMSDSLTNVMFEALFANHRDYTKVKAPALAIYATTFFDITSGDSTRQAQMRDWEEKHMKPFRAMSMARIAREIPTLESLSVPGTHADFVFTARDQVSSAMTRFLTDK
jgi:pimeloyl-ACP methyl ester carboxylesterase